MPATVDLQLGASHVKCGAVGARTSTPSGGAVYTPDSAALDVTGDIDIRIDLTPSDWTPPLPMILAAKWLNTGNQRSWTLILDTAGRPQLVHSTDGTFSAPVFSVSTAAVGATDGTRGALRVTLDVNNGAGGHTATFYTAPTLAGPWTQLGSTVTAAGTTSIFSGSADLTLATCHDGAVIFNDSAGLVGRIHAFALYDGIAGARVAAVDFTDLAPDTAALTDHEGNPWTVEGSSVVVREWTAAPVYERAPVDISRGGAGEAAQPEHSRCTFEINNRSGGYSPRNPTGAYHGLIGRNTPTRVHLAHADTALLLHRAVHDYAFTRDSAGLSVTGDLDIRVDIDLPAWQGLSAILAAKSLTGQRSWVLTLEADGRPRLIWSTDGSNAPLALATRTVPLPHHGRRALRATLDVDDGAGGRTVAFYVASAMPDVEWSESWTGANGSAWAARWVSGGPSPTSPDIQSNGGRQRTGTTAFTTYSRSVASGETASVDSTALVRLTFDNPKVNEYMTVAVRQSGGWSGTFPAVGYFLELDILNNVYTLRRRVSGVVTTLATVTKTFTGGTAVWIRLEAVGADVRAKIWNSGTAEPSWDTAVTDTSVSTAGHVGLAVQSGVGSVCTALWDDLAVSQWQQLGDPVAESGTTSVFDGTAEVRLGGYSDTYLGTAHAVVYGAEIRNGIGGTVVASPDFTAGADGATSLTDAQGNVWDLAGTAEITARDDRFTGEVADWPPTWDLSGSDVYVPVQAAGIMRRLGQGASPLRSTLRRGLTRRSEVVAYWPCEDGDDSTSIASGLPGHPAMAVAGDPDYASFDGFRCSAALPQLKLSSWTGSVPDYADDAAAFQAWFLLAVPAGGVAAEAPVIRLWAGNATAIIWQLHVTATGGLRLLAFNALLATVVDTGSVSYGGSVAGRLLRVAVDLSQDGADVDHVVTVLDAGATTGYVQGGTLSTATLGTCVRVDVSHERTLDDVAVGHVSVHREILNLFDLDDELNAYLGETAGARLRRLCAEEGIDVVVRGSLTDSTALGYQMPKTLLELLREAAEADGGTLYEPRGFLGLAYRTRASMYSQDELGGAALTLDYSANQVSEFRPVDDDRYTRNDVTVTRVGGASARQVLERGRLSVQDPPTGVGRYDDAPSLSLAADAQTPSQASWRRHLGTVDEFRYPGVGVELARQTYVTDPDLAAAARALDVGDLLVVTNPPPRMPPDDVRQLVRGHTETIRNVTHRITWHCAPASPWDVALYEDTGSRYSSQGSNLGADVSEAATSIVVRTPAGPVWGTADLPYDVAVGGERMTVTAVSGTSSPQTFTVTRSVNGVQKSHREGAEVALFRPVHYGL